MEYKTQIKTGEIKHKAKIKCAKAFRIVAINIIVLFLLSLMPDRDFRLEAFDLKEFISSNIPTHPSLRKTGERSFIVNGVKMSTINYQAENTDIPKIIEFYKEVFLQRNYHIQNQSSDGGFFGIDFLNDDLKIIRITAYQGSIINKPEYIFVELTSSEQGFSKVKDYFLNQEQDMPGEDISWLKRYPGTRRTGSLVVDNGVTTANYILVNQSCVQCVVSFYKEEMLARGWLLEHESYDTPEQRIQSTALNIDTLKERFKEADLPAQQKEQLGEAIEQLELSLQETKKHGSDAEVDETTILSFIKKKERCAISVTYKKFKEVQERTSWKYLKDLEKKKEEDFKLLTDSEAAKVRETISKSFGWDIKESVDIAVMYIPSMKSPGGQKAWF